MDHFETQNIMDAKQLTLEQQFIEKQKCIENLEDEIQHLILKCENTENDKQELKEELKRQKESHIEAIFQFQQQISGSQQSLKAAEMRVEAIHQSFMEFQKEK